MAIPAEHLYEPCTCDSGMRGGLRCGDCGGRGILPKGAKATGAVVEEPTEATVDDGLDDMSINHLRSRAKDLGLSSGGGKGALVARIREATAGEEAAEGEAETEEAEAEPTE